MPSIPVDVSDGRITINLALSLLRERGWTKHRATLYRELERRRVPLYRVGKTITFSPTVVSDILTDYRSGGR
jgi:hypothetical protein